MPPASTGRFFTTSAIGEVKVRWGLPAEGVEGKMVAGLQETGEGGQRASHMGAGGWLRRGERKSRTEGEGERAGLRGLR